MLSQADLKIMQRLQDDALFDPSRHTPVTVYSLGAPTTDIHGNPTRGAWVSTSATCYWFRQTTARERILAQMAPDRAVMASDAVAAMPEGSVVKMDEIEVFGRRYRVLDFHEVRKIADRSRIHYLRVDLEVVTPA